MARPGCGGSAFLRLLSLTSVYSSERRARVFSASPLFHVSLSSIMPPRRSTRLATPAKGKATASGSKSWADSAGTGDRAGFLGVGGLAGAVLQNAGALGLLATTPAFAIYL